MSTSNVEQLLFILDQAFKGDEWHSLVANLRSVEPAQWSWVPDGGRRSIRDVVRHVGGTKYMYQDYAFGDANLRWDSRLVDGEGVLHDLSSTLEWLREGQRRLRTSMAGLSDDDLMTPRLTNWGELRETRWITQVMIAHDFYHAGEFNHLRALAAGDDRWEYEKEG